MKLNAPLIKWPRSQRSRAFRALAAFAVITILLSASSVRADSVRINQVVQTLSTYQGTSDLKLSTLQDPGTVASKGSTPAGGPRSKTPNNSEVSGESSAKIDALLSFPLVQDAQKLGVEVVEEAEVEGTICDCGEILVAGGAFPKWPLLFLAAVPLAFINDCEDCNDNPTSTPTPTPPNNPTPTPTPTPEPASLLLFGTGLLAAGAGLRRRYANSKLTARNEITKEDE